MSFRQDNKNLDLEWRKSTRTELLITGLPDVVIDDERRWNYVMLHGYDVKSDWRPEWITMDPAAEFLRLLRSHYEPGPALWLFGLLEKRINETAFPE